MTETSEPKRRGRKPAGGPTPLRNIRVADDLWNAAKTTAEARAETLTSVIEDALRRYVARHRADIARHDELLARLDAAVTAETRAAVASVVEHEIDRECGRQDATAAAGARTLALAGLRMDLHTIHVEANGTDRGLDGVVDAQLRILVRQGLDARRCQCPTIDVHGHRGRCTGHYEADVPEVAAARLCGTCYCAS